MATKLKKENFIGLIIDLENMVEESIPAYEELGRRIKSAKNTVALLKEEYGITDGDIAEYKKEVSDDVTTKNPAVEDIPVFDKEGVLNLEKINTEEQFKKVAEYLDKVLEANKWYYIYSDAFTTSRRKLLPAKVILTETLYKGTRVIEKKFLFEDGDAWTLYETVSGHVSYISKTHLIVIHSQIDYFIEIIKNKV